MPTRSEPFVIGQIYHVFNKTIEKKPIFTGHEYCARFLDLFRYYRSLKANLSYSRYQILDEKTKSKIDESLSIEKYFDVDIFCYTLMPTHFHLLLRQRQDLGISRFISSVSSSLSHYFNIRNERKGPLFLPQFKSVRITKGEQLIHASRYIHLNIYSAGLIDHIEKLTSYPWSSYREYINGHALDLCEKNTILSYFGEDEKLYKKFVEGNAEHQKMLEEVKYTTKWI